MSKGGLMGNLKGGKEKVKKDAMSQIVHFFEKNGILDWIGLDWIRGK